MRSASHRGIIYKFRRDRAICTEFRATVTKAKATWIHSMCDYIQELTKSSYREILRHHSLGSSQRSIVREVQGSSE